MPLFRHRRRAPEAADSSLLAAGRTLHVGIDVRFWDKSGLGTYVRELLGGAARLGLPIAWTVVGPDALREQLPDGLEIERWIDWDRPMYHPLAAARYPRQRGLDCFHYPHYNLPLAIGAPAVASVFDLFHLRYGSLARQVYQRWFLRRLRWSGARIITASQKTADELETIGRIARRRIDRIALGCGRELPSQPVAPPGDVTLLTGARLRPPWLLAVGIDQPHKNFDELISVLSLYYQRRPDAPSLVWTGLSEEGAQRRARAIPASMRDRIALEPFRSPERIEGLYAGARALIFPSLDEGFGLPPLEAMARGVPVICARREPMLAILGDAPLYFEPADSPSLWRMIDRLLDVPSIAREVARRGAARATRFSWERCAEETWGVYCRIAARRGRRRESAAPASADNENAETASPPRNPT
jgi:alpha-1,3-rhamnosyl/mannosyltransferase